MRIDDQCRECHKVLKPGVLLWEIGIFRYCTNCVRIGVMPKPRVSKVKEEK